MKSLRGPASLLLALAVVLVVYSSVASAVSITDCANGRAHSKLDSVVISGCTTADDVCRFVRGTNASIEVNFETTSPFVSATIEVYGKIHGMSLPFPITPNEVCGNYGFQCPVAAGQKEKLTLQVPVRQFYPKTPVIVQFKTMDERRLPIFCVEFPAKIVDA